MAIRRVLEAPRYPNHGMVWRTDGLDRIRVLVRRWPGAHAPSGFWLAFLPAKRRARIRWRAGGARHRAARWCRPCWEPGFESDARHAWTCVLRLLTQPALVSRETSESRRLRNGRGFKSVAAPAHSGIQAIERDPPLGPQPYFNRHISISSIRARGYWRHMVRRMRVWIAEGGVESGSIGWQADARRIHLPAALRLLENRAQWLCLFSLFLYKHSTPSHVLHAASSTSVHGASSPGAAVWNGRGGRLGMDTSMECTSLTPTRHTHAMPAFR